MYKFLILNEPNFDLETRPPLSDKAAREWSYEKSIVHLRGVALNVGLKIPGKNALDVIENSETFQFYPM